MDGPLVLDQELGNALFAPPDVVVENHADRPPGTADVRHSTGAKNVGFVRDAEVYAGDANKTGAQAGRPPVGRWHGRNHLRGTQSRTSSNPKRATPHLLLFEWVFFSWMNFSLHTDCRCAGACFSRDLRKG